MITVNEIAQHFNIATGTARTYLSPSSAGMCRKRDDVRKYAEEMGWKPRKAKPQWTERSVCCVVCGKEVAFKSPNQKYCPECAHEARKEYERNKRKKRYARNVSGGYWRNGCFHTKEEEHNRMIELRAKGFSNAEIAKKIGRNVRCVYEHIGVQPKAMTALNMAQMGKLRSQKNAIRKQFVANEQVAEYNRKVEECNQKRTELKKLQRTVNDMEKAIQKDKKKVTKLVQKTVRYPDMELPVVKMAKIAQ
jgi:DNA-binding CsgD family transcriptional regulator